ncbi:MAG: CoA pyrophosphatase [Acidobacteriota bacterium]
MANDEPLIRDFGQRLCEALAGPLPGLEAQLRMAPRPRTGWDPSRLPADLRDAAALVLIYPGADQTPPSSGAMRLHLPLTVRGAALRNHTGQVSLPGGRVDAGESFETAALREAAEEVGIAPASVRVLGRLTPLHIPVSRYLLHPIVGLADARPAFSAAEWEVARILEVPVAHLADPAVVRRETQLRERDGHMVEIDVPYFDVDGERVWGATAMVLAEFLAILEGLEGWRLGGVEG